MWKISDSRRWRLIDNMEDIHFNSDGNTIATEQETTGWGFFNEEISFFLTDFFTKRLDNEDKLIFFSYYITGMTLEEMAERFYSNTQIKKFSSDEECDEDDSVDLRHDSHQALHKKLAKINKMLSHAWQYSDRWRD